MDQSIFWIPCGVVLILYGVLCLNANIYRKYTQWKNSIAGLRSHISSETIKYGKIKGVAIIILGLAVLFVGLFISK